MQLVEQVAGTFLLQETKPALLHGALTIITSGSDAGWVLISLSPSGPSLSCAAKADSLRVEMDLEIALRLAGALLLLASTQVDELSEDRDVDIGELEILGRSGQKVMSWASARDTPDLKVASEEGGTVVRLHSSLAAAVAFRILRQAGQVSTAPNSSV